MNQLLVVTGAVIAVGAFVIALHVPMASFGIFAGVVALSCGLGRMRE